MGALVSLPPEGGQQWHLLILPCPPNPIDEQAVVASMPHVTIIQWYCLHLLYVAHWLFLRYVLSAEHERLADIGCCQRYSIIVITPMFGTPHYWLVPPIMLWSPLIGPQCDHDGLALQLLLSLLTCNFKKDVYISNKVLVGLKCPTLQLTPLTCASY